MTDSTTTQIKDLTANPAPLGLLGFGMTTVLLNFHNAGFYELNSMILAMGLCYGGTAQIIAVYDGDGRSVRAVHVLYGLDGRWRLEDDRRRTLVEQRIRRLLQRGVAGRGGDDGAAPGRGLFRPGVGRAGGDPVIG